MNRKRIRKAVLAAAAVLMIAGGAIGIYAGDYYRADETAVEAMADSTGISVYEAKDGMTVFAPEAAQAGLIFYPGGKVEYTAYAPLMRALAEEEILCVLLEMPLNLAVLDVDAAAAVQERFANIENWYIGGHSLGGAMAASHAAKNADDYAGLVLLASYSTEDLKQTQLEVAAIYGSADRVLNMEKYEQYRGNLPENTLEVVIDGGNHAQFGSYGHQESDGEAAIPAEEQVAQAVAAVTELIFY